jgi:hypothetical protein
MFVRKIKLVVLLRIGLQVMNGKRANIFVHLKYRFEKVRVI